MIKGCCVGGRSGYTGNVRMRAGFGAMALLATLPFAPLRGAAQNVAEGITDTVDKKRRSPVLSVEATASGGAAKILVDTFIPNEEYRQYPVMVQFFVNRQLVATQYRSNELPGPLGLDVGRNIATVPFNYAIVATLLHPNRQFVTIAQGAVVQQQTALPSTPLTCTITLVGENSGTFSGPLNDGATQNGSTLSLSFKGVSAGEDPIERDIVATVTVGDGDAASAKVTVDSADETIVTDLAMSGTAKRSTNGRLTDLSVSADTGEELRCSPTTTS